MRRFHIFALAAVLSAGSAFAATKLPAPDKFLFWTPAEQALGYRNIEKIFPVHTVKRSGPVRALPATGKPFDVAYDFRGKRWNTGAFMKANNVSGLLVVKNGKIVLERYGLGRKASDRWTSFSVAKSVTSTLVGAAIGDGAIAGLDAKITRYIPELKGSAYDGVGVRDLLTMRSGVKWNEDYSDPKSDVARFSAEPIVAYMKRLPRAHAPGTHFNYDTGETNLAGVLVMRATHKSLADYLAEKVWSKIGAEQDAVWMLNREGSELGGCCISMTLRDYARFALWFMEGGHGVLPAGWTAQAASKRTPSDFGGLGYGYFWWTHDDGTYEAIGIFGQSIFIAPKERLVIVTNSAWPEADATPRYIVHDAYVAAVRKALK
ncbi:MAG TPA: serine hydrolase domain-containing protein [Rhizomicrobium sp.]|nr:serine hydrolase domain-containing protein [Rhizomicrobium sp.]